MSNMFYNAVASSYIVLLGMVALAVTSTPAVSSAEKNNGMEMVYRDGYEWL